MPHFDDEGLTCDVLLSLPGTPPYIIDFDLRRPTRHHFKERKIKQQYTPTSSTLGYTPLILVASDWTTVITGSRDATSKPSYQTTWMPET